MPTIPDLDVPRHHGRVSLRDVAQRDIPEILIAHQDDPDLSASLGLGRAPSGAELGRAIEAEPERRASGSGATLTILETGCDDCRGQVRVSQVDWDHERAELTIWVAPQARRRELARWALRLAAAWLAEVGGIKRVQLRCSPANEPLIRAARAAGFHHEGTLRAHELERGVAADRAVLSLLSTELEAAP